MPDWYKWPTKTSFDVWHTNVKNALGIPKLGSNAETGETDPTAVGVEQYTQLHKVSTTDWRAMVETEIAAQYSDGLGTPADPPPINLDL